MISVQNLRRALGCVVLLLAACDSAPSSSSAERSEAPAKVQEPAASVVRWNVDESGHVMHGYDPVAYHRDESAQRGSTSTSLKWDGATWLFASRENRVAFEAEPQKYVPAVGGYCSFGVVIEKKLDGDPSVFWMDGDKLHLFLNPEVRDKFMQDASGNAKRLVANWPLLRDRDPASFP